MSPADITPGAELSAGLARRLAAVGLIPAGRSTLQPASLRPAPDEHRHAA